MDERDYKALNKKQPIKFKKMTVLQQLEKKIENISRSFNEQISILQKQIKELSQPEEPQGYKGLNKAYLLKDNSICWADCEAHDNILGYGIITSVGWLHNFEFKKSFIRRLATPSEIKSAILKGCEQNGIVKGAKVKSMVSGIGWILNNDTDVHYNDTENTLYIDGVRVFDNGKFAEVVKETELDEYKKTHNLVNPLKDSSDKELLKKCRDAIDVYLNEGVLTYATCEILLTKIEQTLKP